MDTVLLTREGTILKKEKPVSGQVLSLLSHTVALGPGFTLDSFFRMVRTYPDLARLSEYMGPLLDMTAAASETGLLKTEEIHGLTFFKTIRMKGFPPPPRLEIYNSLKGIKDDETILLKFFQLDSLLAHEVTLGALRHVIFGDGQDMFTYETFYSLYELLEGITWELSFNFNPLQCTIRR